jgi:hypothetical protein
MENFTREEKYVYMDRAFSIKVLNGEEGFKVVVIDENAEKQIPFQGKCTNENYFEICKKGAAKDPVDDIIAVMKKTIDLWIDKGLL